MIRALAAMCVLTAAACGGPAAQVPGSTRSCPVASAVVYADWHPRQVVGTPPPGLPRDEAWLVRLGHRPLAGDGAIAPGPLAGYEVAKLGLGPLPAQVWVLGSGAPCAARVTGYAAEAFDDVAIVDAIVTGCPGPAADAALPIAWIALAERAPDTCRVVAAQASDPDAPLPDAWAMAEPEAACPGCELRWRAAEVAGTPALTAIAVAHLERDDGGRACYRDDGYRYGLYATPAEGAPLALAIPGAPALFGALVDGGGVRTALTTTADGWGAYDVGADGALTDGRTVAFLAGGGDPVAIPLAEPCAIW